MVKSAQNSSWQWLQQVLSNHFKDFPQTFYSQWLPREQQSIVDEAQSKTHIYHMQTADLEKISLHGLDEVTVDSPIAKVASLLLSLNRVTCCRRANSEYISV